MFPKHVAIIDENQCIGCTKCIDACPVDAIIGAFSQMHTVIARECIGCALCLPPCPTQCIAMVNNEDSLTFDPLKSKERHRAKKSRSIQKMSQKLTTLNQITDKQTMKNKLKEILG